MLKLIKVMKDIKNSSYLQRSSHAAVITVFVFAQNGKMAFKALFVPRELNVFVSHRLLVGGIVFGHETSNRIRN